MKKYILVILFFIISINVFSQDLAEYNYIQNLDPIARAQYLNANEEWVYTNGMSKFSKDGWSRVINFGGANKRITFIKFLRDLDNDGYGDAENYIALRNYNISRNYPGGGNYVQEYAYYLSQASLRLQKFSINVYDSLDNSLLFTKSLFLSYSIHNGITYLRYEPTFNVTWSGFTMATWVIDCNDTDVNLPTHFERRYKDLDGDGYAGVSWFRVPAGCSSTPGYATIDDCDDYDPTINLNPVDWYKDLDGDGYGDINDRIYSCFPPFNNYVRNSDDCNDSNPNINIDKIWYADIDQDGYGDENDTLFVACPPDNYIRDCYFDDCPTIAGKRTNGCPLVDYDFDNDNKNYNYTRIYLEEFEPNDLLTVTDDKVIEQITYTDGFGNVTQTNNIKFSPLGKDIIQHIEYDGNGNITKNYLPYVSANDDGLYDDNSLTNTQNYYNTPEFDNTVNPYVEKIKDNSPFNKTIEIALPGEDWKSSNGHTIKTEKQPQFLSDNVRKYKIDFTSLNGIAQPHLSFDCDNEYYSDNELVKTISKNLNWSNTQTNLKDNTKEVYTNQFGRTLLERKFNSEANTINHDTYYIYDEVGNLNYVLPPKAVDILEGGTGARPANIFQITLPWTKIANVSKELAIEKNKTLKEVKIASVKEQVLNEKYNAQGAIDISVNTNNEVTVEINLSPDEPMPLINGLLIKLETEKPIKDQELGVISDNDYNYIFYIQNNAIFIAGKGKVTLISEIFESYQQYSTCDLDQNVLDNLCYQYKYDFKNRLIEKKLPGKGWEYILYNKKGQVALTQNAIQRTNNQWNFVKYDAFGRVAYTGLTKTNYNRNDIQDLLLNTGNPFETKTSTLTTIGINTTATTISYTNNNSYSEINDEEVLTAFYYDDYAYGDKVMFMPFDINGNLVSSYTKNLPTISKIRALGHNEWITKVNYYDDKGRIIVASNNSDFANNEVKIDLDFTGKVLKTENNHIKNIYNGDDMVVNTIDEYQYDRVGRLLKQEKSINGQLAEVIFENQYSELGRLISKGIGNKVGEDRLQTIDIKYNVFGLLKGINDVANLGNDLFAYEINYSNPTDASTTKMYDGSISEVRWKSASNTSAIKSYTYSYDSLNRINKAEFDNSIDSLQDFGLNSITYDKNGNIYSLERTGTLSQTTYDIIDDLSYVYDSNSNKLLGVSDNAGEKGFKNGTNTGDDYVYDIDGRLIVDNNKGITNIEYNYLNQPTVITFYNDVATNPGDFEAGKIIYSYDALGNKLSKFIKQSSLSSGSITYYNGNMVYSQGSGSAPIVLTHIKHAEGYIKVNGIDLKYVYQFKDHLGNIRLSYSDLNNNNLVDANEITEESDFYPFGLKHDNYSTIVGVEYPNKFNGKELEQALGLNLYEMDFRLYDQTLGRFMVVDPMAEINGQISFSPYAFAHNNPISLSDPSGLCPECGDPSGYKDGYEVARNGERYIIQDGDWVRDGGTLDEVELPQSQKSVMNEEMAYGMVDANEQDWDREQEEWDGINFWGYGDENSGAGRSGKSGSDWDMGDLPGGFGNKQNNLVVKFFRWLSGSSRKINKVIPNIPSKSVVSKPQNDTIFNMDVKRPKTFGSGFDGGFNVRGIEGGIKLNRDIDKINKTWPNSQITIDTIIIKN